MGPINGDELEVLLFSSSQKGRLVDSLTRELRQLIEQGRLAHNFKMPASRHLARQINVSRNTVLNTYENLMASGHLTSKVGSGTFVKFIGDSVLQKPTNSMVEQLIQNRYQQENIHPVLPEQHQQRWNFSVGVPETRYFPHDSWRKCLNVAARKLAKGELSKSGVQGSENLRNAIAYHVSQSRAVPALASHLLVTSGVQQALYLLAKVMIEPNVTKVAIEHPGYPMARLVFERAGAIIVEVSVDQHGMKVEDIPSDVALVYVTPSHQFPMGVALSAERRASLLALASQHNMCILEDDYDCEFRIGSVPIDALKAQDNMERVVYLGTFSKSMMASLRVGFAVVPAWLLPSLLAAKMEVDWFSPTLVQESIAEFITRGELKKYIRKMRRLYEERFYVLNSALKKYGIALIMPHAGVHATAILPEHISAEALANSARESNVSVPSFSQFYPKQLVANALAFGVGCIESQDKDVAIDALFSNVNSNRINTV